MSVSIAATDVRPASRGSSTATALRSALTSSEETSVSRFKSREPISSMAQMHCCIRAIIPDLASRLIREGSAGWKESRALPAHGPVFVGIAVGLAQTRVRSFEDDTNVARWPRAPAVSDVSVERVAHQHIDGQLNNGVRVYQLTGVGAPDQEHTPAVLSSTCTHPERVDGPALDRVLRQLQPHETAGTSPQGVRSGSPVGRRYGTS
jgi:hypothetical protein